MQVCSGCGRCGKALVPVTDDCRFCALRSYVWLNPGRTTKAVMQAIGIAKVEDLAPFIFPLARQGVIHLKAAIDGFVWEPNRL